MAEVPPPTTYTAPAAYTGDGWWCEVCEVECNAQDSYDAHMAGKKHGKMVVAQNVLKRLRKTETCFRYDDESGAYWCLICNLEVTSPQVLEQHFKSAKHKGEAEKIKGGGRPAHKSSSPPRWQQKNLPPQHKSASPPRWGQKKAWSPPRRRSPSPPRGRGRSPSPARKRSRSPPSWGTRKQSPVGGRYRPGSPRRSPRRSPRKSPHRSPRRSPRRYSPRRSLSPGQRRQRSRSRDRNIGNGNDRHAPGFDARRPPQVDERKLSDFRQAESRLVTRHKKIQEELERNPESHPMYDNEWKKFWERRFREIENQGGNPLRHDYNSEWVSYWMQKMMALADLDMERERRELLENFNMDDPGPPPPKLPPVTYPGFGPTPTQPETPKENLTSHSSWPESSYKNENNNMLPTVQAAGNRTPGDPHQRRNDPHPRRDDPHPRRDDPQSRRDDPHSRRDDARPRKDTPRSRRDEPRPRRDEPRSRRDDHRPRRESSANSGHQQPRNGSKSDEKDFTVVGTLKMLRDLNRDYGVLGTFGPAINCLLVKAVDMIEKGEDAMDLFRDEDSKMMIRLATDKLSSQLASNNYGAPQLYRTQTTIERGRWLQNAGNDMFGLDIDVIARATIGLSTVQVAQSVTKALTNVGQIPDENNLKKILYAVTTIHGKLLSQAPSFPSSSTSTSTSSALFPSGVPASVSEPSSRGDSPAPGSGALSLLMSSYDEGAMSLLKSYDDDAEEHEPNSLGDLEKKSLKELQDLLVNFASLKKDDQKELTAFLKRLETTDSNKVTRLREMVRAKSKANAAKKANTKPPAEVKRNNPSLKSDSINASNQNSPLQGKFPNKSANPYGNFLQGGFSMNATTAANAPWSLR